MSDKDDSNCPPTAPRQAVLFPAETEDYELVQGSLGWGLVANRAIPAGDLVFDDYSLEFNFADVVDGDKLLLLSDESQQYISLTRDMLVRTHGVPTLLPDPSGETAGTISWQLEVPGMFMNHSCEPTTVDHLADDGEGRAACDIQEGQELSFDYVLNYYDHGPFFETCRCGSAKCRGKMFGFKALSDEEKEHLLPKATAAVQAMHRADTGQGLPVKREQRVFAPRNASNAAESILRLVCPGPSWAEAEVAVQETATPGEYELVAQRDFAEGERLYYFWCADSWPDLSNDAFNLVFSSPYTESDPAEGTVVRIALSPSKRLPFSCWQLLVAHSDEPNIAYKSSDSDESWRSAYATKEIKAGEKLTVDYYNSSA